METKICQNCKQEFRIEPEDFEFYEKIKVPPPTWCPECRLVRRLLTRNERSLYRRKCDLCQKDIIARYHPDLPFPVYCVPCWYSDRWDPLDYGRGYDFSKQFFTQFQELGKVVPRPAMFRIQDVNSDYCNQCLDVKNVYLSSSILYGEDILYSYRLDKSRDTIDCAHGRNLERCYEVLDTLSTTNVQFSRYVRNSLDSSLLYDVRGSSNCFGCVNLRNAKHRIFNQPYTPEEYQRERGQYDTGSYQTLQEIQKRFDVLKSSVPRLHRVVEKSVSIVGDNVQNSKNCYWCFDSYDVEDSKFIFAGIDGVRDSYDINHSGVQCEKNYEGWSVIGTGNKFSIGPQGSYMEYSEFCHHRNASNFFGCISIPLERHFCIFNKQYTKEEYEKLIPQIKQHMDEMSYTDAKGMVYHYGEFFPPEMSPFGYNETIAQDYFPLTKEQALSQGYKWKDPEPRNYEITIKSQDLPDHIKDVDDSILKQVIGCLHEGKCNDQCTTAFKIIPQELEFYQKMNLPLPRLCPNCRHYQRLKQRNPLKLWHRKCMCGGDKSVHSINSGNIYTNQTTHFHQDQSCPNEFETSYAPDRSEIVYCEQCYQAEVV